MQHLDPAAHVETDLEDLQDVEIQIRPDIEAVVAEVPGRVGILGRQQAGIAQVIQVHIVAGVLGTAVQDDVGIPELAEGTHRLAVPVHVHAGAVLIGIQLGLAVCRSPDHAVVVGDGLVVQGGEFVGAQGLLEGSGGLQAVAHAGAHGRTAFHAATGGDPDDTVGAPFTVEGEGRGVLEDFDFLDLSRRDGGHILLVHLEPVHEDLGGGPGAHAVGSHAADKPLGRVVAQFAASLHHREPVEGTGEGIGQVGVLGLVKLVAGGGGNGARAIFLGRERHGREKGAKERGISSNQLFHSNPPFNQ